MIHLNADIHQQPCCLHSGTECDPFQKVAHDLIMSIRAFLQPHSSSVFDPRSLKRLSATSQCDRLFCTLLKLHGNVLLLFT